MQINNHWSDSDQLGSSLLVDGDSLEVVEKFFFFGMVVTSNNNISSKFRAGESCIPWASSTADIQKTQPAWNVRYNAHWFAWWSSMDTSPGSFERKTQTLWACLSDAFSNHLWWCVRAWSLEKKDEQRVCWAVRQTEHPDGGEGWQDTIAGACYEDTELMSRQEGVGNLDQIK